MQRQIAFAFVGLALVEFGLASVFFGASFTDLSGNVVMDSVAGVALRSSLS